MLVCWKRLITWLGETTNKKAVLSQRWPRDARYISRPRSWAVADIWPFKIVQDCGGRHLEFVRIENSAIRSAVPENPTLEPNMKWIGSPVAEIWPFAYIGAYGTPILGGRGGRRGSAMTPLERAMVVSYRLSIVTVALSVTIRPQFVIECLRCSNQLTSGDIIFEEFQHMWSQFTNVTDRRTDRRHAIAIPRFALKCIAR